MSASGTRRPSMIVPRLDVVPSVPGRVSPAAVGFERGGGAGAGGSHR